MYLKQKHNCIKSFLWSCSTNKCKAEQKRPLNKCFKAETMQQLNNIKLSRRKKQDYLEKFIYKFVCFKQVLVYSYFRLACLTIRETETFSRKGGPKRWCLIAAIQNSRKQPLLWVAKNRYYRIHAPTTKNASARKLKLTPARRFFHRN